ncbi:MAG TPA: Gfo/Idh/MocA family oxidoreductase [Flavobacteriaceae bacterium]|nr:Gfo/Idh/MocA family oxidoreductase [Flavobacteriaceae bacterium]
MKKQYNWAIIGCGNIAKKFASDLKTIPKANLYAVASRSLQKAEEFAKNNSFKKHYGSYADLVKDNKVDVVYIATPHALHLEHTLLCLKHKKAVLCEKAFAINSKEVKQMIAASEENNTFLMEAFWTRFKPKFKKVMELSQLPKLGKLKFLKSNFMFNAPFNPNERLYDVNLGGGSLLDIGIYPVFHSLQFLGKPASIKTSATFSKTKAEESIVVILDYNNGAKAILTSSFAATSKNETELCFENGYIKFDREPNTPIQFFYDNNFSEINSEEHKTMGYNFEAEHVMDCLDKNLIESPILTHQFSLDLIEILDKIRKEAGIIFPNHD